MAHDDLYEAACEDNEQLITAIEEALMCLDSDARQLARFGRKPMLPVRAATETLRKALGGED